MHVRNWTALAVLSSVCAVVSCSEGGPTEPEIPVSVETEALAEAIEGQAYAQQLEATGGSGSYRWEIASGSLPAGLTLASSGTISGAPTGPGLASFRVRAIDAAGDAGTADLSIDVTPVLTIHTGSLGDAEVAVPYQAQLVAVGGRPSHVWHIAGGDAGAWLAVSEDGELTGTPDAAGSRTVIVAVTDASGQESTRELALTIRDPLLVATATVPEAAQARAYGVQLEAAGGDGAYAWGISAGALPQGLTLAAAGAITGLPEQAGSFGFTAEVVDGAGRTAARAFTLMVKPMPTIRTASLPPGSPGAPYTVALQATGGTGQYGWSLTGGSLPAGLAMSAQGVVSGTPNAVGTSSFTVRVVDQAGEMDTQDLTLTVVAELQTLESGVAVTGLSDTDGGDRFFVIDVPAGSTRLSVSISGGTGDADLYVRHGALPMDFTYDCRPLRQGNEEACTMPSPEPGAWYVRLRAFEAYDGVELLATHEN